MANIAQALKAEIIRVSRKEIKASVQSLQNSNVALKKTVADLKKRVAALESENKRLSSYHKEAQKPAVAPENGEKVRITSKGIRALRSKLGLSQDAFAKILGVSSQAVFHMEHKEGTVKLRPATLSNLLAVKQMGKREVKKKLEEMTGKK